MIIAVPEEDQSTPTIDGEPYPYAVMDGDQTLYSDSITELVGALIGGYLDDEKFVPQNYVDATDENAYIMRLTAFSYLATAGCEFEAAVLTAEGEFDPQVAGEDPTTALLTPYSELITADGGWTLESLLDKDDQGNPVWNHSPRLWLLRSDFAPFTDRTAPGGNILWLDPTNEREFLASLEEAGHLKFFVHADA